jgi:hypothetical protein
MKIKVKEAIISKEKYAIIKSREPLERAFTNIIDKNEVTSIIQQKGLSNKSIIKVQKNFRLITFNMILPFTMVGFISKVSTALAKERIPIFVISAYTTDHILIKERYAPKAIKVLTKLGFIVKISK